MNITELAKISNVDIVEHPEHEFLDYVEAEREEISPVIGLETMNANLLNAAELLTIAFHALDGSNQQSLVVELNSGLYRACGECFTKVNAFGAASVEAIRTIAEAYYWLQRAMEKAALAKLATVKKHADKMVVETDRLCKIFEVLANQARAALVGSVGERNEAKQRVQQITRDLAEYSAENASLTAMKEQYDETIAQYQENYDAEKSAESTAESRQFAMDMTGLFTGMISGIVSVIPEVLNNIGDKEEKPAQAQEGQPGPDEGNEKKKAMEDAQKKQQEQQAQLDNLKKELAELEKQKSPGQPADEQTESSIGRKKEEIKIKENELNEAKAKTEDARRDYSALTEKISGVLDKTSQAAAASATAQQSVSERHNQAAKEIFKMKHELELKRVETLGKMKKFAALVSNLTLENDSEETAVQTLSYAVASLQRVVTALEDTRTFWNSVSEYCERLASEQLKGMIESNTEITDSEIRRELYSSSMFQGTLIRFLCQWYAIYQMCAEFVSEGKNSIDLIRKKLQESHFGEQSRIAAKQKASLFLKEIDEEIEASKKKQKKLSEEKERLGYGEA